jgi:hypothetical protein
MISRASTGSSRFMSRCDCGFLYEPIAPAGWPRLLILLASPKHSRYPVPSRCLRGKSRKMPAPSGFDHVSTTHEIAHAASRPPSVGNGVREDSLKVGRPTAISEVLRISLGTHQTIMESHPLANTAKGWGTRPGGLPMHACPRPACHRPKHLPPVYPT